VVVNHTRQQVASIGVNHLVKLTCRHLALTENSGYTVVLND
jgi:hypothetical protein